MIIVVVRAPFANCRKRSLVCRIDAMWCWDQLELCSSSKIKWARNLSYIDIVFQPLLFFIRFCLLYSMLQCRYWVRFGVECFTFLSSRNTFNLNGLIRKIETKREKCLKDRQIMTRGKRIEKHTESSEQTIIIIRKRRKIFHISMLNYVVRRIAWFNNNPVTNNCFINSMGWKQLLCAITMCFELSRGYWLLDSNRPKREQETFNRFVQCRGGEDRDLNSTIYIMLSRLCN